MLYKIFQLTSLNTGAGGLFDFGATLPLMVIQFLILMTILDNILYSPILNVIDERDEYIQSSLKKSAELIEKANQLNKTYEEEIFAAKTSSQANLSQYLKTSKERFSNYITSVKKVYNRAIEKSINELRQQQRNNLKVILNENEKVLTMQILDTILD